MTTSFLNNCLLKVSTDIKYKNQQLLGPGLIKLRAMGMGAFYNMLQAYISLPMCQQIAMQM